MRLKPLISPIERNSFNFEEKVKNYENHI